MANISNKFHEENYEEEWILPNWTHIQQNEDLLSKKTFELKTGDNSSVLKTKWIIGFKKNTLKISNVGLYWKVVDITGYNGNILVKMSTKAITSKSTICNTDIDLSNPELNKMNIVPMYEPERNIRSQPYPVAAELKVKLKLLIGIPINEVMDKLSRNSALKLSNDFLRLLNDENTSDLKIVTSDKKEFLAHQLILKARCQIFQNIFCVEMMEDNKCIVNFDDISGKTMEFLLTYFYSGKLDESWKDPDSIVEFTYAVGKFQMTDILKILDVYIGIRDDESDPETTADINVRLLEQANKFSLKHAEIKLIERIAKWNKNI